MKQIFSLLLLGVTFGSKNQQQSCLLDSEEDSTASDGPSCLEDACDDEEYQSTSGDVITRGGSADGGDATIRGRGTATGGAGGVGGNALGGRGGYGGNAINFGRHG